MVSQIAKDTARLIKEDRGGADYYYDPDILAPFLESQMNLPAEAARALAQHIREDRDGADYYDNEEILAQYLSGNLVEV